jgi:TP901 family phage tail tape measure protein
MASERQYKAKVTIGGVISGSFKAMLGSANDGLARIGAAVKGLDQEYRQLGSAVKSFTAAGLDVSHMTAEYAQLGKQVETLKAAQGQLLRVEKARAANQERIQALWGRVPGGAMLGAAAGAFGLGAAITSFENLDDATTNLRVALMDRGGGVPAQFGRIRQEAIQLGNVLPGTTADFINVAVALKEQGTSVQAIAGGALQAASYLGVVLKVPVEQAAEMTAKLREAFQLSEGELGKMADLSQRAKYAYGLTPDDLLLGAKYYGGKLGSLGLTGAGNVRRIYALQGIAAQNGMDGSTFGTNFGQMLSRTALLQDKLHKQSKEMKAVNATLAHYRIQLQFFDKQGKFGGIENLVTQLQKLNVLTQQQRLTVLQRLFGEEGMRPAELIGRKGQAGFAAALAAADQQASLQQRIDVAMGSFRNKLEALQGTVENFTADAVTPLAQAMIPLMDRANAFIGGTLQNWVDGHQRLLRAMELGTAGLLGFKAATLVTRIAGRLLWGELLTLAAIPARLNAGFTLATRGLKTMRLAMLSFDAVALLNPVTWAVVGAAVAIGGAALLIRRHWSEVKAFLGGVGAGIGEALRPAAAVFAPLASGMRGLGVYAQEAGQWFGRLVQPVQVTGAGLQNAAAAGRLFGLWLGNSANVALQGMMGLANCIAWIIEHIGEVGREMAKLPSPAHAWQGISGWWHERFGDGAGGGAAGNAGTAAGLPALVPGNAPAAVTVTNHNQITIHQQPGQDARALAEQIHRHLTERAGMVRRGLLYDPAGA